VSDKPICLCPPASEYDPPCPEHGVVGIGVTPPRDCVPGKHALIALTEIEKRARAALSCAEEVVRDPYALMDPAAVVRLLAYVIDGVPRGVDEVARNARMDCVSAKLRRDGHITTASPGITVREEPAK